MQVATGKIMQTVKDSVEIERTRLDAAFAALENAVENYTRQPENQAGTQPESVETIQELKEQIKSLTAQNNVLNAQATPDAEANLSNSVPEQAAPAVSNIASNNEEVISQIQQIVKTHESRIGELREEIGRLSVDLVRLKDENRALRDQNKQAAELIGESITTIKQLVAA